MDYLAVTKCMEYLNDKIPEDKYYIVQEALINLDYSYYEKLEQIKLFSPLKTVLFSTFLGFLAIDRFYLKDYKLAIFKLLLGWLTFGLWGIWDISISYKKSKKKNYEILKKVLNIKERN